MNSAAVIANDIKARLLPDPILLTSKRFIPK